MRLTVFYFILEYMLICFRCKVSESFKLFDLMVIPFTQAPKNMTSKIVRLSIPSGEKKRNIPASEGACAE